LRTSIEVIVEVEVDRPPAAVWSFLSDAARIPEWFSELTVTRIEPEEDIGVGTRVHYALAPGDRTSTLEVVEWDPPRRMAWDGPPLRMLGGTARPRGSHTLTQTGGERTLLRSVYRPELSGAAVLLRPYIKRWLRRERQASADALKVALEGTTG
jgi:uncharacterized protein YndB with AHSA1/START domain